MTPHRRRPERRQRRSPERKQTWDALMLLHDYECDQVIDCLHDPIQMSRSNSEIQETLDNMGVKVTLPAITARLQSLQDYGCIDIQYWLTKEGHMLRTIFLLKEP